MTTQQPIEMAKPARRTQEERRAETRAKLIDATLKLLAERGVAKVTTEEVAKAAGLTRGSIQYHFASPNDLLKAAVIELPNRLGTKLDVAKLQALPLADRIDRVVDQMWNGYGSATYTAFVELVVRGRLDPELKFHVLDAVAQLEEERGNTWSEIFSDSQRKAQEVIVWRSSLVVMLRGLALTKMLSKSGDTLEAEILQFKSMFKLFLVGR